MTVLACRESGAENYRDVGAFVNLLARSFVLPEGRLLRGGSIRHLVSLQSVGGPRTVLNLQATPDPVWDGVTALHFPFAGKDDDVYSTRTREVRTWLRGIFRRLSEGVAVPLLVHCSAGRDRTGVCVALLLRVLGVADQLTVAEYGLSGGTPGEGAIRGALDGLGDAEQYFRGIRLDAVERCLLDGS